MFTIQQIGEAHARVKSGADFPAYIQELKALGVRAYDSHVADGRTTYFGAGNHTATGTPKYPAMPIAESGSETVLGRALRIHQEGGTDYPSFCKQAADAGVEKWTVDLNKMTCTYYDRSGKTILREKIPEPPRRART